MKSILLAIINASFLLFCSIAASESLLIKNITLLSPDRDASFGNAYVLVENDRRTGTQDRQQELLDRAAATA